MKGAMILEQFASALRDNLGTFYYILVYGVGLIAMALSISAFQFKHKVAIILCNFLAQSSWVIYFLLQGDLTSAISCGLSATMLAVFSRQEKWKWVKHPLCIAFFISLFACFSAFSFSVWSDVFPLMAGIFAVIANSRSTEKRLRQFSILWCTSWMINSIFKMYPVAFANDLFCTISTIVALIRYRDKKSESDPTA